MKNRGRRLEGERLNDMEEMIAKQLKEKVRSRTQWKLENGSAGDKEKSSRQDRAKARKRTAGDDEGGGDLHVAGVAGDQGYDDLQAVGVEGGGDLHALGFEGDGEGAGFERGGDLQVASVAGDEGDDDMQATGVEGGGDW